MDSRVLEHLEESPDALAEWLDAHYSSVIHAGIRAGLGRTSSGSREHSDQCYGLALERLSCTAGVRAVVLRILAEETDPTTYFKWVAMMMAIDAFRPTAVEERTVHDVSLDQRAHVPQSLEERPLLHSSEALREFNTALDALPPRSRRVIRERHKNRRSLRAIAELLSSTATTLTVADVVALYDEGFSALRKALDHLRP